MSRDGAVIFLGGYEEKRMNEFVDQAIVNGLSTAAKYDFGMRELVHDFFKPEECEDMHEDKTDYGVELMGGASSTLAKNREEPAPDAVHHPSHYKQFGVEVIDIIRHVLGPDGFRAYCIGNELKYRLRAGDKGDAAQDIAKAMKYREFRGCK